MNLMLIKSSATTTTTNGKKIHIYFHFVGYIYVHVQRNAIPTSAWDINWQLKCHAPSILRIQIEAALY